MKNENLTPLKIPYSARKIRYKQKEYDILASKYPHEKLGKGKVVKRKDKFYVHTDLNISLCAIGDIVSHEGDLVDEFIIKEIFGRVKKSN